jgi:predicted GH43/DUF377 family glycosyl hydrolase
MVYFAPENKRFGDFDIIQFEDKYYCIFIENTRDATAIISKGSCFGLATSSNGVDWEYQGQVLAPGKTDSEKWKSRSLFAMDIVKRKDDFALLYSAIADGEDPNELQQVGIAYSKDLREWKDDPANPIITNQMTDPYYAPVTRQKFCWRDPNITYANGKYHCLFSARERDVAFELGACVGLFTSSDLINWTPEPPVFTPRKYWELETADSYHVQGKWYMLFGEYTNGLVMRYAVSDRFNGEYVEPKYNILTPSQCYAARICQINNVCRFYHWIKDRFQGKKERYLAPPKAVKTTECGILLCKDEEVASRYTPVDFANFNSRISTNNNVSTSIDINTSDIEIIIRTDDSKYERTISLTKFSEGFSVREFSPGYDPHDMRTVPHILSKSNKLELYIWDKFLDIYIDGHWAHSVLVEKTRAGLKEIAVHSF